MRAFGKILIRLIVATSVVLAVPCGYLHAETTATVDLNPRLVRSGDSFTVEIRIESDEDIRMLAPAFPTPEGISIGNRGNSQELLMRNGVTNRTFNYFASYNAQTPGKIEIGPFRINYTDEQGAQQEIVLDPVTVEIYEDAPRPSSDIIAGISHDWIKWLIGTLLLAMIGGLIYALVRLRKRGPAETQAPLTGRKKSLEEEALDEIIKLEIPNASDEKAVKAYYDSVDDILRIYMRKGYDVSTHDATLWEIRQEFQRRKRMDSRIKGIFGILNDCDWVKFAKTKPSDGEIRDVVGRCSDALKGTAVDDK